MRSIEIHGGATCAATCARRAAAVGLLLTALVLVPAPASSGPAYRDWSFTNLFSSLAGSG